VARVEKGAPLTKNRFVTYVFDKWLPGSCLCPRPELLSGVEADRTEPTPYFTFSWDDVPEQLSCLFLQHVSLTSPITYIPPGPLLEKYTMQGQGSLDPDQSCTITQPQTLQG
jgi:hypothetical protein